jgi:hypothetical protein
MGLMFVDPKELPGNIPIGPVVDVKVFQPQYVYVVGPLPPVTDVCPTVAINELPPELPPEVLFLIKGALLKKLIM